MRILRTVTVVLFVLALSSCAYLFDSPFPAYLTHAVAQADISDLIPYIDGGHYEARAINSPTGEYVWLMGEGPGFTRRFVLFDEGLDVVLESTDAVKDKFDGRSLLMFDDIGQFFCGDLSYNATFGPLANNAWSRSHGYWDLAAGGEYRFLEIVGDTTDEFWSTDLTAPNAGVTRMMSGGLYNYPVGVEAVANDWQSGLVAMYAIPDFGYELHGVVATQNGFLGSLADPITADTRFFTIFLDGEMHDRPQFAGDGTVIFTEQDGRDRMVLYDLEGKEADTYVTNDHGDVRYTYSPSGDYWYIMDASAGKLFKAKTWW